jgi:hypothetical protein
MLGNSLGKNTNTTTLWQKKEQLEIKVAVDKATDVFLIPIHKGKHVPLDI